MYAACSQGHLEIVKELIVLSQIQITDSDLQISKQKGLDFTKLKYEKNEANQRLKLERIERERLERERLERERLEQQKRMEKLECQRLQQERLERERQEQEWMEREKRLEEEKKLEKAKHEKEINQILELHTAVVTLRNTHQGKMENLEELIESANDVSVKEGIYQPLRAIQQRIQVSNSALLQHSESSYMMENEESLKKFHSYVAMLKEFIEWIEKEKILGAVTDGLVDCQFKKNNIFAHFSQLFTTQVFQELWQYNDTIPKENINNVYSKWKNGNSDTIIYQKASQQTTISLSHLFALISDSFLNGNLFISSNMSQLMDDAQQKLMDEKNYLKSFEMNDVPKSIKLLLVKRYKEMEQAENSLKLLMDMIYNLRLIHNELVSKMDLINNGIHFKQEFSVMEEEKLETSHKISTLQQSMEYWKAKLKLPNSKDKAIQMIEQLNHDIQEEKKKVLDCISKMNETKMKLFQLYKLGFKDVIPAVYEDESPVLTITKTILNDPNFSLSEMTAENFESIIAFPNNANHTLLLATDFNGKKFIAKEYKISDEKMMNQFKKELKVITRLNHPNIIKVESIYAESGKYGLSSLFVVMPYFSGGNLKNYLTLIPPSKKKNTVFWERIWRQVLMAIENVHSCGVIHCDIKPENIFVEEVNQFVRVILGDFDVCHDNQSRTMNLKTRTIAGTWDYLAPEVLNGNEPASFSSDMYAFGMTVRNCMAKQELDECPSLKKLVEQCLSKNGQERPTASECLANDFFLLDTVPFEEEFQKRMHQVQRSQKELEIEKEFTIKQKEELNQIKKENQTKKQNLEKQQESLKKQRADQEQILKKQEDDLKRKMQNENDDHRQ